MLEADVGVETNEIADVVEDARSCEKGHSDSQVAEGRADEKAACQVGVLKDHAGIDKVDGVRS